jgi:RimJ/RimL family protein N-acetyltransferase
LSIEEGLEIEMYLRGEKVIIRPMVSEDVRKMEAWRPFTAPLDALWNGSPHSSNDYIRCQVQTNDPSRRWYAVEDLAGLLIGRLSLRHISRRKSARLGITLGADYVGQGYGTDALRTFLVYYFRELGFEALYLDVAAPNKRAIRCYEKCGFECINSHYQGIGSDGRLAFLKDDVYRDIRRFFKKKKGRNVVLFYDMKIAKENLKPQAY